MPRYFFDFFDHDAPAPGEHAEWDGLDLADAEAARRAALAFLPRYAGDRLRSDLDQQALDLQVRDERGQSIYRVRLVMHGERPATNQTGPVATALPMIRSQSERLILADQLVAEGEALCRRQAALLRWWQGQGWDTAAAEALLVWFELNLTRTRLYRAWLQGDPVARLVPDPDPGQERPL